MKRLLEGTVKPAKDNEKPLTTSEIDDLMTELNHDWECIDHHHIVRDYSFPDFVTALAFVNKVGEYAEDINHHPEITFTWGKVALSIYTHDVGGLREEDFFWAAHVENIYQSMDLS